MHSGITSFFNYNKVVSSSPFSFLINFSSSNPIFINASSKEFIEILTLDKVINLLKRP